MRSFSGENRPEMRDSTDINMAVKGILAQDPVWAAYAIADLRPDLAPFCRWTVAPDASGLALLFTGLEPPILLTAGSSEGVAAALNDAALPEEIFLSVRESHIPAVQQHYARVERHEMLRMALAPGQQVPEPTVPTVTLSTADELRLQSLYQHGGEFAPDAFITSQLHDGFFFGIEDRRGHLAAAGGTHIAYRRKNATSPGLQKSHRQKSDSIDCILAQGVAAIGNIYSRPDCRGRGFGTAVTARITQALQADGYNFIVLNVSKQNLVAQSIYEKLGFARHCLFVEGVAKRG
ncbi:MAG: GNAT family N-acetyltransferase [Caldilineaceae bacterium]|nr:GNAT family N-acetyltransferase [Caldilineaceae bacterium]